LDYHKIALSCQGERNEQDYRRIPVAYASAILQGSAYRVFPYALGEACMRSGAITT